MKSTRQNALRATAGLALAIALIAPNLASAQYCGGSVSATHTEHVAAGRATASSSQDCSACFLGVCGLPSGCAVTRTTYSATGSGDALGGSGSDEVVLYEAPEAGSWRLEPCELPTRFISVPDAAFRPRSYNASAGCCGAFAGAYINESGGALIAPVVLPNDATPTLVEFSVTDLSDTTNLRLCFGEIPFSSYPGYSNMDCVDSSADDDYMQIVELPLTKGQSPEEGLRLIVFAVDANGDTALWPDFDSRLAVRVARVYYQ